MILAGIDEAGYGPVLGPLVVGACAFEVPDGLDNPCLWKRLKKVVSKNRSKSGRTLHVNDSKLVYSSTFGLKELEKSVLAISSCLHDWPADLDHFVRSVAHHAVPELAEHRWYAPPAGETFPLELEATSVRIMVNAMKYEMERSETQCVHLAARVVSERPLNRLFNATRNKSNTLFSIASIHLDELVRKFGQRNLTIFCDRQGGRSHYGKLLREMFPDWSLEITEESDGKSIYKLKQHQHEVVILFAEKAETKSMSVAVASMLCKYLRESLMSRFNAYWQQHVPGIAPTAGYYTDGQRFLGDIAAARTALGVSDDDLIRSR